MKDRPGEIIPVPSQRPVRPLFPLPDVTLFPGVIQPLHVFEPRYRQMVGDVLDGPGEIVLGTVLGDDQADLPGAPPVQPIAGLGRVVQYERLEDGRYLIQLRGEARVRIEEVTSERLYRKVYMEPVVDSPAARARVEPFRSELLHAIETRADVDLELPEELPVSTLTDLLLMQLELEPEVLHQLYSKTNLDERVREVLAAHHAEA